MGEKYINWIAVFLKDGKQRVLVNGESSDWKDVSSGIPQGSVLGPTLFVLYINDLPSAISSESEMFLFADDTKIYIIFEGTDFEKLQMDAWSENGY